MTTGSKSPCLQRCSSWNETTGHNVRNIRPRVVRVGKATKKERGASVPCRKLSVFLHTDRQRQRQRGGPTDRDTQIQIETETGRQTDRQTGTLRNIPQNLCINEYTLTPSKTIH